MSEYGYMKHLFWNYRLYFIQIDFGLVSCYVICFSSIFLDLKYFQFNITVCLISFEYKRTAVKFSSGHYLSMFCSFLWVLPSLYGTLRSPIVWNLKPNQLCVISVTHSLQGCWGSCPGNRVITMLWRGLMRTEVLDVIWPKVCSHTRLQKMACRDLLVHHPFFSKHWNQNRPLKDYFRAITFYPKDDYL